MQKRGHRHKGAAPADLALTQLREWTHGFKPAPRAAAAAAAAIRTLRVMDCPTFLLAPLPPLSFLVLSRVASPRHHPDGLCEFALLIRFIEALHQTRRRYSQNVLGSGRSSSPDAR